MAKALPASRRTTKTPSTSAPKKAQPAKRTALQHAKQRAMQGAVNKMVRDREVRDRKLARARETIMKGLEQMFEATAMKLPQRRVVTKSVAAVLDGIDPSVKSKPKKALPVVT